MSITSRSLCRRALVVSLLGLAACAVPTEPRWERATPVDQPTPPPVSSSAERYTVEVAPVIASAEFRSRILPATETVLVAPGAGRTVGRLVATGDVVAVGDPIIEWSAGVDDTTQLRIEILELEIDLAELEGRNADVAATRAELAALRAASDRENTEVILSPIDGVIGRYLTERSVQFEVGDELVTVGDPGRTRVDIVVTADAVGSVAEGSSLRVIDAQNRFAEPVTAIVTDVIVPTARQAETDVVVSAVLSDATVLPVGTRVVVNVNRQSDGAERRLAADAVLDDGLGPFVIVENASGWHRVDIEVGLATDDVVELLTDLPVGATVVVP